MFNNIEYTVSCKDVHLNLLERLHQLLLSLASAIVSAHVVITLLSVAEHRLALHSLFEDRCRVVSLNEAIW